MIIRAASSAPGKAILFGEHAVVHGAAAIAAALSDLRIVVFIILDLPGVVEVNRPEGLVTITFEDFLNDEGSPINLTKQLPDIIGQSSREQFVEDIAGAVGSLKEGVSYNPSADEIAYLKEVYSDIDNPNVAQGMYAVSYLLTHLLPQSILDQNKACISINVKSNGLPIGAGLGSSAAFSVALSAACCSLRNQILYPLEGIISDSSSSETKAVVPNLHQLEIINRWAFAAEVLLHGSPSGLDNTTSCFGGFVLFKRDMSTGGNINNRLSAGPLPLRLLLCNTGVPRSTKQLVGKVNALKLRYPKVVESIFSSIDAITTAFTEIMTAQEKEAGRDSQGDCFAERISHVGELMATNHLLLCALGVGHQSLDAVRACCLSRECPCKLTGAGGGGCAIALTSRCHCGLCSDKENELAIVESLKDDLRVIGVDSFESSLGREGVLWYL